MTERDPQFDSYRTVLKLAEVHQTKNALRLAIDAAGIKVNEDDPISGYYRLRRGKDGPIDPVEMYRAGDELYVYWGAQEVSELHQVWPMCLWNPVKFAWVKDALAGKGWPDVHQYIEPDEADVVGPGHNSGATLDELEALKKQVEIALAGVKKYAGGITSDDQGKASQTLRSDLLKYSREAKRTRETLNQPAKNQIDANNKKWKPVEDDAQDGADTIRKAQEAWETVKLRRARAEQARLDEEKRQYEAALAEQAEAAQAAIDAGETPPEPVYQAPPTVPERVAPQTSFKGGSGRAAHVKAKEAIEEVVDWKALFLWLIDDEQMRTLARKRAQTIMDNTGEIPAGCRTDVAAKVA
jgi:hypothetical protein